MARAGGAPRDANPYRVDAHSTRGTVSIAHRLTAEERLAIRLETAWRIGWEAVDRELSNAPTTPPDPRRRVVRP